MKNLPLLVLLPLLLTACATIGPSADPSAGQNAGQSAGEAVTPALTASPAAAPGATEHAERAGADEPRQASSESDQDQDRAEAESEAAATNTDSGASLPANELTDAILFRYLTSEIAAQRGLWDAAYINMLGIAQETRDARVARRATEIALNAKESAAALAAVRLWRELDPGSEEAAQYYLGFSILGNNLEETQPLLVERLQSVTPQQRGAAILQIQRLLARASDRTAAYALLTEILQPYQGLMESHLALAQAAAQNGDQARALAEAEQALAIAPASELAILTLAQITPDQRTASARLADFLRAHPHAREARLAYARMLIEQKDFERARDEFKLLLVGNPQDLTVLYALGLLGTQTNQLQEAETYLTAYLDALESQPAAGRDPSQALLLLSQLAEQRDDTAGALKWLARIDPLNPRTYMTAQIRRANLVAKDGNLAGARKLLQETRVSGQEEQVQLVLAEGQLLRNANRLADAARVLQAGLKRFPDHTDLLYDYAMVAERMQQLERMEVSLRRIIALDPDNQHAYNALGYSLADRNLRLEEAYKLIRKASELAPDDPFIMDSLGWVYFRMGNLKEAETLLRRAHSLRPDPEIATHLGEVLWITGQRDAAREIWRKANQMDPGNNTLKNTLARLQVKL